MDAKKLKDSYIGFFAERGHVEIPSASLVPQNDPTTLFISAGMHPLVPYLLGQPHPAGRRLVNVQKCLRTGDIDEVGDTFHHTFFEMLGNWSLGDYFKTEMIPWSYQFLIEVIKVDPGHLHVTCFAGDSNAPKDEESANLWLSLGIPQERIHFLSKKDNWWGPAGITGPCGPDTEMFIDTRPQSGPVDFETGCRQGRLIEIWNDVFMEYNKNQSGGYVRLSQRNVDTGLGVERNTAILEGHQDNYLSSIWQPIISQIENVSRLSYADSNNLRPMRIVADHLRASVFIVADGVEPSNKEAGYVLRRLIRRAVRQGKLLGISQPFVAEVAQSVIDHRQNFAGDYPELSANRQKIISVLVQEEKKFLTTIEKGLRQISKLINSSGRLTGKDAFTLYESYGFPLEMVIEEISKHHLSFTKDDLDQFNQAKSSHQQQSQTLSAGKFKSGLADHTEIITKYHTATHLLHATLRRLLGQHVQQAGSNITDERLRFDFTHHSALTSDLILQAEEMVNHQIAQSLPVSCQKMPFAQAIKEGALAFFASKYPDTVTVYTVGHPDNIFSREVCTGPHVDNIGSLGRFKIIKEESAGSGKRRIYATLEAL